ncbi:exo-rhamnogalacturonan lyase family protein [Chitinophaga tropicalis]|uniref:Tat pathway signal sequence domain protein n=1 Tax=Chitinophaga tropicalis TaxID=2683588 RepID=A0A7K1UEM5_9BACT|nr:Tat pathway signal sequence domain protein [Chitinophaga tropicalis]MVT12425.1 Tat pathway signal sequence domain protein [Chitinophaga tropicalis]
MEKRSLSRRDFVKQTGIFTAGLPVVSALPSSFTGMAVAEPVSLHWLDNKAPGFTAGVTWGVPWPRGTVKRDTGFVLQDGGREQVPVQSWPLATWPDGSLKWSAHAIGAGKGLTAGLELTPAKQGIVKGGVSVKEQADSILIDNGLLQCEIGRTGSAFIRSIKRNGKVSALSGKLVLQTQDAYGTEGEGVVTSEWYEGKIDKVTVEQTGPIRAVVKVEGRHTNAKERSWLPFVLRLYFYENSESVRIIHTIVYDGDEHKDFIRGLGLRFDVPLSGELTDRHIRFAGEGQGIFAEAVKGLTGLRRDPGKEVREAQVAGKATPAGDSLPDGVAPRLQYIPAFGDYTLFQPTPDAFEIRKRTREGYGWIQSAYGKRAAGTGYVGTPQGGLAFGIRNFWQSCPAQLDIRNAHTEMGQVTLWLWAPSAAPMDLRFYHDGMGQDTFAKQREGLEITYEDYEPGFGTPMGVARTSELQLWALPSTPSNEQLAGIAAYVQDPHNLTFAISQWEKAGVLGGSWNIPYTSSPEKEKIKEQLDFYFGYYQRQVEERHWYGFWNYGDVMHSYDQDRHVWRYDVGGFAWDNSELSTDLWLWYFYLHTGRKDVFRMAEAMTRHTGEVDVHHIGPFAPLGSRHNVQHWGCSAKQLRISTVANRRFYYYLTADERVGDLMHAEVDAAYTLRTIVPGRKVGQPVGDPQGEYAGVSFGTDWGSLAAAWLTEWERTGNTTAKDRLLNSMATIAAQPNGFFTGNAQMELASGKFLPEKKDKISVSHLSAVFGLPEICAELVALVDMPAFEKAWLQYCELYNASAEEQKAVLGRPLGKLNLRQSHSRLTAFAARRKKDKQLAERAWREFLGGEAGIRKFSDTLHTIGGPAVLNPISEADGISTNAVAQWGLAAMALLDYAGDHYING